MRDARGIEFVDLELERNWAEPRTQSPLDPKSVRKRTAQAREKEASTDKSHGEVDVLDDPWSRGNPRKIVANLSELLDFQANFADDLRQAANHLAREKRRGQFAFSSCDQEHSTCALAVDRGAEPGQDRRRVVGR